VMIVEIGALRRILDETVLPQSEGPDGRTWLATVRELAEDFFGGRRQGTAILEIPLAPSEGLERPVEEFAAGSRA
jgi:hypothetical protein